MEKYGKYLLLLARMNMNLCLQTKQNPSDLVQQTLLRAHQAMRQTGWSCENRTAWLRKVFASVVADEARRANRQKRRLTMERSLEAALDDSSARLEKFLTADQVTPSEQAAQNERALLLAEALSRLPEDQRIAIELHHLSGFSLVETAKEMGRSDASVAGLLRRGLKSLRELLTDADKD